MSSYNKILNNIKHCQTKDKIIPFKNILEYTEKEKINPKNSTKLLIPKGSKFKSFTNLNNNIKNMLNYHNKNRIETPKHKIKKINLFTRSRNENNKLFLSNNMNSTSSYKNYKFNTIEGRQLSSTRRYSKNIFTITKSKVSFPELNLLKKRNNFKTINDNENLLYEKYNMIKLNDANSIHTSMKKLSKYSINQKSTFQKSSDFNLLKLKNNSKFKLTQNKKASNLKKVDIRIEMNNKIQSEKNIDTLNIKRINTVEKINYNSKNVNKKEIKVERNKANKYRINYANTPKMKKKRKSSFNFTPNEKTKKEKNFSKEIDISSDSSRFKTNKKFSKRLEIMVTPYKNRKNKKKKENFTKVNFRLLSEDESKIIIDTKERKRSKDNNDDRKQHIINKIKTHKSCKNLKQSYYMADKNLLHENKSINNNSNENEKENKSNSLNKKKLNLNDFLQKEFFDLGNKTLNTGKNIIIFSDKKSGLDLKKILCDFYINKDEEKYIMKKRLKVNNKIKENNNSSYLYQEYTKELKDNLRNTVIDKMTEKMMEHSKSLLQNKRKDSMSEKEKEIFMTELFNAILDKSHKIYYSFEDIIKIGKSLIKYIKIENKVKINNIHILEKFDIYQTLLKQFENKWKILKQKDIHYYQKMNGIFSSIKIKDSKEDFYIYKHRIKNETILSLDSSSFNIQLNRNKINKNKLNDINNNNINYNNNINKTIKYKDDYIPKLSSKKNNKINLLSKLKNLNSGNKKRLSFAFEKMGFLGFDNNFKINKKNSNDADSTKFKKRDSLNILSKICGITENFYNDKYKKNNNQFEKEKQFNTAKANINNYNILKNKKLFNMNSNDGETELKKKYSNKNNFINNLSSKYLESFTFKYHDIDSLSKVASVIKTQEIQRDVPESKLFDKIVDALSNRKIKDFDYLIKNEEEAFNRIINRQELSTGNTLLMYATTNNLRSIVEILLKKGAEPNTQNNFGNSALHLAYKNDNIFIINLLLEHGAEQKIKNINGLFPWQMSKFINN